MVLALMCFGALDTTSKVMAATVPVGLALWVRFVVQSTLTGVLLVPSEGRALFRTRRPWLQALRGLLLVSCNGLAYLSLRVLPVGEFTAVATLTPFIYLQIVFGAIGGWLVFEHVPDAWALLGIVVIVLCGLLGTGLLRRRLAPMRPR